jgi:hypothetical protein
MRLPAFLLAASLLGVVAGASLIGTWAVGAAVIFDSLCVGGWALFHDDGEQPQVREVHGPLTLQQVLDRARAS